MNRNKFSGERYLSLDNSFLTDGVDDRIDFGHIPITGDFSFSVFVKRISDVPFDDFFFGQYDNNGVLRGWGLLISFNEPSFVIRDATGTVQATYGLGVIPKTDWFHFVGVFKSGQYLRTYLNGSLVYQENTAIVSPPNTSFLGGLIKTCIGRNSNNGIQANAEFAHATIFNKSLNQDEIIFMHRYVGAVPQSAHESCIFHAPLSYKNIGKRSYFDVSSLSVPVSVNQVGHGFSVGDCIRNTGTWVIADGTVLVNISNPPTVVSNVVDADNFEYVQEGLATIAGHGFAVGTRLFCQVDGSLSTEETLNVIADVVDANTLHIASAVRYGMNTVHGQYNYAKVSPVQDIAGIIEGKALDELSINDKVRTFPTIASTSQIDLYTNQEATLYSANAKLYDGATQYDVVNAWSQIDRLQAFTMNFDLYFNTPTPAAQWVYSQGDIDAIIGMQLVVLPTVIGLILRAAPADLILINWNLASPLIGNKSLILSYDGSSDANGFKLYLDNVELPKIIFNNSLTSSIISGVYLDLLIGQRGFITPTERFFGQIKNYEILNRVATPSEISQAALYGSFTNAGIAYTSGDYLLAIDFDKNNGNTLTTYTGTPSYAITSFGGTVYTKYKELEAESAYPKIDSILHLSNFDLTNKVITPQLSLPNNSSDFTYNFGFKLPAEQIPVAVNTYCRIFTIKNNVNMNSLEVRYNYFTELLEFVAGVSEAFVFTLTRDKIESVNLSVAITRESGVIKFWMNGFIIAQTSTPLDLTGATIIKLGNYA